MFALIMTMGAVQAKEFSIIVHKDQAEGNIAARDRFLLAEGLDAWSDGTPVVAFEIEEKGDLKKLIIENGFIKAILGMSRGAYNQYWIDQKSAGRTNRPVSVKKFKSILRKVKREKGGIAYIPSELVTGDVKVISKFEVN